MTITWQSSNFWATLYSQCLHYAWASNRLYGREYGRPSARRVATEINRFWRLRDRLRRRTTWKNLSSRRPTSPMRSQDTRLTRRRASDWWNILSEHLPVVHTHTHTRNDMHAIVQYVMALGWWLAASSKDDSLCRVYLSATISRIKLVCATWHWDTVGATPWRRGRDGVVGWGLRGRAEWPEPRSMMDS